MISDRSTLDRLAKEMANVVRRDPEHRRGPLDAAGREPFRLVGIVADHAIIRRPKRAMMVLPLNEFDAWPLCDKDGIVTNGN